MQNNYSSKKDKRNNGNLVPWSSSVKALPKQVIRYSRGSSKRMLAQAYKSMPKEAIMSKRTVATRRTNNSRRNKIPPGFKDNTKEDQTLQLLMKHLKTESSSKLPKVVSQTEFRTATNFMNSRKRLSKQVSVLQHKPTIVQKPLYVT